MRPSTIARTALGVILVGFVSYLADLDILAALSLAWLLMFGLGSLLATALGALD
jgi:hypothetical protein